MPQISNVITKLALASVFWSSVVIAVILVLPLNKTHARISNITVSFQ